MPYAADLYANFTTTILHGGAGGGGTQLAHGDASMSVPTGVGARYPSPSSGQGYTLLVGDSAGTNEIIRVTARSGDGMSGLQRGQEGTTAHDWPAGTPVELYVTAKAFTNIWSHIANLVTNAMDYGATGNGSTDDTAALQAGINATPSGGAFYMPGGTYIVSAPLSLKDNRRYYGDCDMTWIKQANGANITCLMATSNYLSNTNIVNNPLFVENLGFDGNDANNTTADGFVLQAWQSVVRQCWFKHLPGNAVVVTDRCSDGTTLVTNSVVENKLYDLKIANTGANGIFVTDHNGQCTDGRIMCCDINTTALTGMRVDRAAGWYITDNHLYSIIGSGYTFDKCFATWICHNQIADFGNSASVSGTFSGMGITCIEGYPTVVADNIILCHEADASSSYTFLSITMDGFLTATYGTYCIVHDNQIRGAYTGSGGSVLSLGLNIGATSQQQTSAQPAGILLYGNHFDRVHTLQSIGSYITANWITFEVYGPAKLDGDVSLGGHIISSAPGGLTITAGGSAGGSPPAPNVVAGHDARGDVQFGTGTSPSTGVMVHVAFNVAYASVPIVLICPVNDLTAGLVLDVGTVTVNGFDVRATVAPAASQVHTTYEFTYLVIQ